MTRKWPILVILIGIIVVGGVLYHITTHNGLPFGPERSRSSVTTESKRISPLKPAVDAYNAGNYKQAESEAFRIINENR